MPSFPPSYGPALTSKISDVVWGFYFSILEDDIFRAIERIESKKNKLPTLLYNLELDWSISFNQSEYTFLHLDIQVPLYI